MTLPVAAKRTSDVPLADYEAEMLIKAGNR
jgi:hypothetical protein